MRSVPDIDIIDLDDPTSFPDCKENRAAQMALTVSYIKGKISNSDLITMKVFLGLLPPIATPSYSTGLIMKIASARLEKDGISGLVGAAIIASEVGRIFTLEEQLVILNRLKGKS